MRPDLPEKILEAAELLITRFGFKKVTMEDIAREAGVARATIYLHFKDKKEVGLACADRVHFRLLAYLREIVAVPLPPLQRLRQMLVGRVLFAFDAAQDVSMKFDDMFAAIKPLYMSRRELYFDNEAQIFLEVLKEGIRSKEIAVDDAPLTALSLVLATNAFMPFSLSPRQLKARPEIEQRVSKIADLILKGISRGNALEQSGNLSGRSSRRRKHVEAK